MKAKLTTYLPLAAIAAGVVLAAKKGGVSGVGRCGVGATKEREVVGKAVYCKLKGHSVYGNPKFILHIETADGDLLFGETPNNGSIGYSLGNFVMYNANGLVRWSANAVWTYHVTASGNVIIDYVRPIK